LQKYSGEIIFQKLNENKKSVFYADYVDFENVAKCSYIKDTGQKYFIHNKTVAKLYSSALFVTKFN
jgi:hypothetical protein